MSDTLNDVVDRYIHLGEKDPRRVRERVMDELGDRLLDVVTPHLEDFIDELARQRLNSERRREVARITPQTVSNREIMLKSIWIPLNGTILYKRIADVTAAEFEARAAYLDRMIVGISNHAQWCRDVADAIRAIKGKTASDLSALPPLPQHALSA